MSKNIKKVLLTDLKASSKTQVRIQLNPEALADYTQHAKDCKEKGADPEFPALVAFEDEKGVLHLADGFTRRAALKEAKFTEYDVEIKKGSAFDAFKYGAKINQTHGARLSTKDKRNILSIALEDKETCKLSNNQIAKDYGFSEFFVRTHRPKNKTPEFVEAVNKKTGKKTKVNTGKIGKKSGKTKPAAAAAAPGAAATTADENAGLDEALNVPGTVGGSGTGAAAAPAADVETEKALDRVVKVCTEGGVPGADKIKASINSGSLALSSRDVRDWAGTSDRRIIQAAHLILDLQWKPKAAFAFIDKPVTSASKVEQLVNLAIAGGKGYTPGQGNVFERVTDSKSTLVAAFDTSKVAIVLDAATGVITISPK